MKTYYFFTRLIFSLILFITTAFSPHVKAQCSVNAGNDTTVYIGYSPMGCVTLTATPTGTPPFSYLWSNGDTGQSINVCDTVVTTYVVTVTDSTLCTATDTVVVHVNDVRCGPHNNKVLVCHVPPGDLMNAHDICVSQNAVPAHLAHGDHLGSCVVAAPCDVDLGNDTAVCSSYILDPGSGYVSYLWSDNSTDQVLPVSQTGIFWVIVIDSSNCTSTDTIMVTIFPAPSANAGNDTTIVPPGCASLFGSVTGGTPPYSFLWSNGDTTQATPACPSVTTTYHFTVIDFNGCSSTDSVTVIVNPPCNVSLGDDSTLCSSEAPIIITAGPGYSSYLWSDSSTAQSLIVLVGGTYWVQVTDSNNCVAIDSITITINPSPNVSAGNDTTVFDPDCASLFGLASGGLPPYSFSWSTGDTIPNITVCNSPGVYPIILIVTDSNGCSSSDTVVVTVLPQAIFIDPNPNSNNTRIYFIAPQTGAASLELFDMTGNRVALLFHETIKEHEQYSISFNSENLLPGIYLMRLTSGEQYVSNRKMVVIR
jgi:hypothetical protein